MKTIPRRFITILLITHALLAADISVLHRNSPAAAPLPVPEGTDVFSFTAVAEPVPTSTDVGGLKPLGVGPLAEGGRELSLSLGLGEFEALVDVYLGVHAPPLNASEIFLITGDGLMLPYSLEGLVPFAKGIPGELFWSAPWGALPANTLPAGVYSFYLMVTPADTLDSYYLWTTSLTVDGGSDPGTLRWVRTGGPLGGLGYDVRMRPDNPDLLYVTDAWAGLHMSTDGGETWFPSNNGIPTSKGPAGDGIPVFCLTIDPHNHDTLWIGLQDVGGIFKSTDGGASWVRKDRGVVETDGITFRGFTVDPGSSQVVYAAAELSSWVWSGEFRSGREFDMTAGVIYKTTDSGENWKAVWRGNNLARYVWIDPRNPSVVYASTGIFDREAADSDSTTNTAGGEGVIKSTDGGQTWQNANTGLKNLYIGTLFMHPEDPDTLLAGAGNNAYPAGGGVYLTTDGAATWERVLGGDMNINSVEFTLADPGIAYAGSAGDIFRSTDGGETWKTVAGGGPDGWGAPGIRAGFPIDFEVDPRDANRIFANNYGGGNFLSDDGGNTWTDASAGYTGAQVRGIAVARDDPASVYAASRSGMFVTRDAGTTWEGLSFPPAASLEWQVVAVDPGNGGHVLAANNWNGDILESTDGGTTWRSAAQSPGPNMSWWAIAHAPSDPSTVYAGSSAFFSAGGFDPVLAAGGIYVSRDGGASWAAANDTLSKDANVTGLAVDPADPETVYASTGNRGLLKTSDGGASWSSQNTGLPEGPAGFVARSVTVHPNDTGVVFAGLEGGGLYWSGNGGQNWQRVEAGLAPEASITSIVFNPVDAATAYVADQRSGVYRSRDGGETWHVINNGLNIRAVNGLALTSDGFHLYAAVEGGGVYRLDLQGKPPEPTVTN